VSTIPTDAELRRLSREKLTFPPPYEAVRPFFDPKTQWGHSGAQCHLAYRTLQDHFPTLSAQEVFLIVITAQRLFGPAHDAS